MNLTQALPLFLYLRQVFTTNLGFALWTYICVDKQGHWNLNFHQKDMTWRANFPQSRNNLLATCPLSSNYSVSMNQEMSSGLSWVALRPDEDNFSTSKWKDMLQLGTGARSGSTGGEKGQAKDTRSWNILSLLRFIHETTGKDLSHKRCQRSRPQPP